MQGHKIMDSKTRNRTEKKRAALSDAQLVEQTRAGSKDAYAQLYRTYLPLLFYFIRKYTRSDADAADLAQDSFVSALIKIDELKDPAAFRSWLFQIGLSKALNAAQNKARHSHDVALDASAFTGDAVTEMLGEEASPGVASPESIHEHREADAELLGALDRLTPVQKDVLILHYYIGFSTPVIAKVLDASPETIRKRLFDARAALRPYIGQQETESSGLVVASLLASSDQASAAIDTPGAKRAADVKMCASLSALAAGGTLDPAALKRTKTFLRDLKHRKGLAEKSRPSVTLGKTALVLVAVATLAGGAGLYVHSRTAADHPSAPPVQAATTPVATSTASATASATASVVATSTSSSQVATLTTTRRPAPTRAPVTAAPTRSAAPTPAPAPTPDPAPARPVITVAHPVLAYAVGTPLTPARVLADAGATAHDPQGRVLPVTVTGLATIDVNVAGTAQVYLRATDSAGLGAPTKVIDLVIE